MGWGWGGWVGGWGRGTHGRAHTHTRSAQTLTHPTTHPPTNHALAPPHTPTQAATKIMGKKRKGRIVNIASGGWVGGRVGGWRVGRWVGGVGWLDGWVGWGGWVGGWVGGRVGGWRVGRWASAWVGGWVRSSSSARGRALSAWQCGAGHPLFSPGIPPTPPHPSCAPTHPTPHAHPPTHPTPHAHPPTPSPQSWGWWATRGRPTTRLPRAA